MDEAEQETQKVRRVVVIGAGVSGITAAKCLLDEGLEPVVGEASSAIGGVWKLVGEGSDGGGLAYRSLRTNTSKQIMAFSDFPFAADLPDFPSRVDVLRYLDAYADHFRVRERIRFGTAVELVTPLPGGRWSVRMRASDGSRDECFDGVLVCSGVFREPVVPVYPGQENFAGTILHSSSYVDAANLEGKTVAIVGVGSSGADIAVETSYAARRVLLCGSKGTWFIPRHIGGRPRDHHLSRLAGRIPKKLGLRLAQRRVLGRYRREGLPDRPSALGFPEPPFSSGRTTANTGMHARAAAGAIVARPDIARLEGHERVFVDGIREGVDVLIFATGYSVRFPFLAEETNPLRDHGPALYKQVFHPDCPGLAFIGMFRVSGPALPVAEMQSRWAARVLRGAVQLPPAAEMLRAIATRRAEVAARGANPFKVEFVPYLDDLAEEIGARPHLWRHPGLLWRLLAGPPTPAQYRLDGPGRWSGAAQAIRAAARPVGEN